VTLRTIPAAQRDMVDAAEWYDLQTPGSGDAFIVAVDQTAARVVLLPRSGWSVARAPRGREIREVLVTGGYPYRLVYELTAAEIVVLAVTHGKQRRQPWRGRVP
jgi:plasmid stabilization system protein ParE